MLSVNVKIIEELKNFLFMVSNDQKLLSVFRSSEKDFTRNRKLPFEKQVKGWKRAKKEAIINGEWDLLPELSKRNQPS